MKRGPSPVKVRQLMSPQTIGLRCHIMVGMYQVLSRRDFMTIAQQFIAGFQMDNESTVP
jgi:hypothetical protein